MNTIIKTSLLSLGLAFATVLMANAETKETSTEAKKEAPVDPKATSSSNKQEIRQKRKEERTKKLLETSEATLKEIETKIAAASDLVKKKATLVLAHAKLELEAAKDVDFSESVAFHARRCKQYLFRAKEILEGKDVKAKEFSESKTSKSEKN